MSGMGSDHAARKFAEDAHRGHEDVLCHFNRPTTKQIR